MTSFVIGVDPGALGAIAILEDNGKLIQVMDMPTVDVVIAGKTKKRVSPELLAADLKMYADQGAVAWVEQVNALPKQGVTSVFAFGQAFGVVLGVLAGLQIPTQTVTPMKWKKGMALNASKDGSRIKATQLWPAMAGDFKRVMDDGRAESALIAYWGIKHSNS